MENEYNLSRIVVDQILEQVPTEAGVQVLGMMNLKKAQSVVRDETASFTEHVEAAGTLVASSESSLEDLIECLRIGGLPCEIASTALYLRTKREHQPGTPFISDPVDWSAYIIKTNVKAGN